MILYVNGDSHTAAAEAVNSFAFAEDDSKYFYMGRAPHPDNLAVSWGKILSQLLKAGFKCDAESAASNQRIIRTTKSWLESSSWNPKEIFVILQWSTWERQEWLIDDVYYQVNASGIDQVPESHQKKYKKYIAEIDWQQAASIAHQEIWQFHQYLDNMNVRHVFFNGNNHFQSIAKDQRKNWGSNYIDPYNSQMTYHQWLSDQNHLTVAPNSWHFGEKSHAAWARFMLQYIVNNKMI